jgi:hypothetical protein
MLESFAMQASELAVHRDRIRRRMRARLDRIDGPVPQRARIGGLAIERRQRSGDDRDGFRRRIEETICNLAQQRTQVRNRDVNDIRRQGRQGH